MSDDFSRSQALLPVDLSRQPPFRLGPAEVRPATLEVVRGDRREVLEPRVMQVLAALYRERGQVVSRDDLIAQCWDGRIVSDDAINRTIGRLRRLAETMAETGQDAPFAIETVPRVGYRLTTADTTALPQAGTQIPASPVPAHSRRAILYAGAGAAAVAAAGSAAWLLWPRTPPAPPMPPRIAEMVAKGVEALRRATPDGQAEAVGIFENVVALAPNVADAWGGLALAYAFISHGAAPGKANAALLRYQAAVDRAFALDPHNGLAYEAKAWHYPWRGAYLESEQAFRDGMKYHPDYDGMPLGLSLRLSAVGRNREAADLAQRAASMQPQPDAASAWVTINTLWAAGRLPEADEAAARGSALYPRATSVWFNRIYLLMFTGKPDAALATMADRDNGPLGLTDYNVSSVADVAMALKTGARADIEKAAQGQLAVSRRGAGFAENAPMFLSALGRVDDAFAAAYACYFGRGFTVTGRRFSDSEGAFTPMQNRRTSALFSPPCRAMRKDPRFAPLVAELGLTDYWKRAGVKPDYQAYPE